MSRSASRGATHFQRIYAASDDPWHYHTSEYERDKREATLAALGARQFHSGLEVGCSIGVLTRMLAPRCHRLLGIDLLEEPLQAARSECADQPWVRFAQMHVPVQWPDEAFDLIVLSEVLYFLTPADIAATAEHMRGSLLPGGRVVLVNWRGQSDDPCTGDEAASLFIRDSAVWLMPQTEQVNPQYRLDVLDRSPST